MRCSSSHARAAASARLRHVTRHSLQAMMPRCPFACRVRHLEAMPACECSASALNPAGALTSRFRFVSSKGDLGCSSMTFSVVVSGGPPLMQCGVCPVTCGLTLNAPVGELGVVSTLSVPQKGQEGQRNVW